MSRRLMDGGRRGTKRSQREKGEHDRDKRAVIHMSESGRHKWARAKRNPRTAILAYLVHLQAREIIGQTAGPAAATLGNV